MKNEKIKKLLSDKKRAQAKINSIELVLQAEYDKLFSDILIIKRWVLALERSNDYQYDEMGAICQWLRVDGLRLFSDCLNYLEDYLNEHYYCTIDRQNNCLISFGSCDDIVITHEGDIFQEHTVIISNSDYDNKTERNKLIESHMKKTGVFPGVFLQDYYGGLTNINTQEK